MAEISAKDIGLYVNEGTEATPDWKLFACSTSDGFSGTTETVTIATKCDSGFVKNLPGDKSWEFTNSCLAQTEPTASQASHSTAFSLWKAGDEKQFKLANADDSYLRIGFGTITSYSETVDAGDYLQFELTITGNGAIADVVST